GPGRLSRRFARRDRIRRCSHRRPRWRPPSRFGQGALAISPAGSWLSMRPVHETLATHLDPRTCVACMTDPAGSPFAPGSVSLRMYPHLDLVAPAIIDELLAQAVLAAESGFDGLMISEHHGGFAG